MARMLRFSWMVALAGLVGGCASARINYTGIEGPRYTGSDAGSAPSAAPTALRVVTFNVQYARAVDSAIALLQQHPSLRSADVVLLQEMDESATQRIAAALEMRYVYYPATVHPVTDRDFGNAILSRWPIVQDEKLVLPYHGLWRRTQRAAVAATLQVGSERIRVYNVHFAMVTEQWRGHRRAQAERVIEDSRRGWDKVIVGGDINDSGLGRLFATAGFSWPTRNESPTGHGWLLDHIFYRGFHPDSTEAAGVVDDVRGASDHKAVWAVVTLPAPGSPAHGR